MTAVSRGTSGRSLAAVALAALGLMLAACSQTVGDSATAGAEWRYGGGDAAGRYYSSLKSINAGNVDRLGFAWSYDLGAARGQEATPLVVGSVMYTSSIMGHVFALNAKTGALIWHYDPQVDGQRARYPCCDSVNRGVAWRHGVVYVAALDGRIHAIDAATGKAKWIADTIVDPGQPYTSTGAVLLTKDAAVIGNSGADMGVTGVRGYVTAVDLATGKLKWRFYTVPPAPGQPLEGPDQALAANSWGPDRTGKHQNGATVWDGLSYDPETNLVIFGTANAAPYIQSERSRTRSDDLFSASIVAVNADTGRRAWHYQETPGEQWDFDATQKFIFANLKLDGADHKVLMQASKNGFFYVLDRASGKLLSADAFTYMNWASGVDLKTGRPNFAPNLDYSHTPRIIYPSWAGGHTWNPMSFDPDTGLVYIPSIDAGNVFMNLKANGGSVKRVEGYFSSNATIPDQTYNPVGSRRVLGPLPDVKTLQAERGATPLVRELLKAWDPVARKIVWSQVTSRGNRGYDGGVLSTAGGLVLQGRGDGKLWVYDARTGRVLKTIDTGSHIMAAPMTYAIDGVQYVAVQAGYGGVGINFPIPSSSAAYGRMNTNRILVFKLDGGETPKPPARRDGPFTPAWASRPAQAVINRGEDLFTEHCSRCHVFGPGITPDLRRLPPEIDKMFDDIPLRGALAPAGMGRFDDVLTKADVDAIHAYLNDQARKARAG